MSLLQDSFFIVTALVVFVVAAVTVGLIVNAFSDAIAGDTNISETARDGAAAMDTAWGDVMDWFMAALLFGLPLVSMGLAHTNIVPNLFFYVTIAVLLLMVFVGWGLQAGFESIAAGGGAFSTYMAANMPISNFIMLHFGIYSVLVVAIIGYGTYAKARQGIGYA